MRTKKGLAQQNKAEADRDPPPRPMNGPALAATVVPSGRRGPRPPATDAESLRALAARRLAGLQRPEGSLENTLGNVMRQLTLAFGGAKYLWALRTPPEEVAVVAVARLDDGTDKTCVLSTGGLVDGFLERHDFEAYLQEHRARSVAPATDGEALRELRALGWTEGQVEEWLSKANNGNQGYKYLRAALVYLANGVACAQGEHLKCGLLTADTFAELWNSLSEEEEEEGDFGERVREAARRQTEALLERIEWPCKEGVTRARSIALPSGAGFKHVYHHHKEWVRDTLQPLVREKAGQVARARSEAARARLSDSMGLQMMDVDARLEHMLATDLKSLETRAADVRAQLDRLRSPRHPEEQQEQEQEEPDQQQHQQQKQQEQRAEEVLAQQEQQQQPRQPEDLGAREQQQPRQPQQPETGWEDLGVQEQLRAAMAPAFRTGLNTQSALLAGVQGRVRRISPRLAEVHPYCRQGVSRLLVADVQARLAADPAKTFDQAYEEVRDKHGAPPLADEFDEAMRETRVADTSLWFSKDLGLQQGRTYTVREMYEAAERAHPAMRSPVQDAVTGAKRRRAERDAPRAKPDAPPPTRPRPRRTAARGQELVMRAVREAEREEGRDRRAARRLEEGDGQTYQVAGLLGKEERDGGTFYHVRWKGYEVTTWEPAGEFEDPAFDEMKKALGPGLTRPVPATA